DPGRAAATVPAGRGRPRPHRRRGPRRGPAHAGQRDRRPAGRAGHIEDLSSRALAFSSDQDTADEPRKQTVLGRQVPERYLRELEARGAFRRLYGADEPVYLDDIPGAMPRVAIRVRAGDEILGSVWAAVTGPLSPEREQALIDSAKLVALHLLRHRAGADVERRLRAGLVATLLEGGPSAPAAAERLGVTNGPVCVLALGLRGPTEPSRVEAELQR